MIGWSATPETDFERALDCLVADRSPRNLALDLSEHELQMLVFAQLLRGIRPPPLDVAFPSTLRLRIALDPA